MTRYLISFDDDFPGGRGVDRVPLRAGGPGDHVRPGRLIEGRSGRDSLLRAAASARLVVADLQRDCLRASRGA